MHRGFLTPRAAFLILAAVLFAALPGWGQTEPADPGDPGAVAPEPDVVLVSPPAAPTILGITDEDTKTDCVVTLTWTISSDDGAGTADVTGYRILRAVDGGAMEELDTAVVGGGIYKDQSCEFGRKYQYQVLALAGDVLSEPAITESIVPATKWIDWDKANVFIIGLIISVSIIYFISHVKAGRKIFIRKIAGLEAVDEAIGRATEMGRPILFIPGILDMNDVQTVSAVIILGRIAKTIAEYDTRLWVPTCKSLVMTTARETVKESYLSAGRPDAYNDDMISYLTDEQFGYVAGVNGIMVREKPATCFYLGAFFAESLILAETGNSIGAIQVAGTAMPSQLPFFIAACDYTLIGEELFAASAYLSQEPMQLGSLKGQDVGKAIAMFSIVVGSVLSTLDGLTGAGFLHTASLWFQNLFSIQ